MEIMCGNKDISLGLKEEEDETDKKRRDMWVKISSNPKRKLESGQVDDMVKNFIVTGECSLT